MSFKKFLQVQDTPWIVYTFGRFNPMTRGHEENFDFIYKHAKKNKLEPWIFTSGTTNNKKNPLNFSDKIYFLKKFFPKMKVSEDNTLKNTFAILEDLIKKGYQRITFVIGEDRKNDFVSLHKYSKQWAEENDTIVDFNILVSGGRTKGVSGTDMRNAVKDDNFELFQSNLPKKANKSDAEDLFDKVKIGLK